MLDAALRALAGRRRRSWPVLLPGAAPTTRIGIKVNVLNGQCPTSVAVVKAIVDALKAGLGVAGGATSSSGIGGSTS